MSDLLGLRSLDVTTGEQDVRRDRVRNLSHQTHCGTAEREEPPLGFGDAELGALTRDADVGALQDFGSAGDGCTLDGGDQRLGQPTALEEAFDLGHVDATAREGISRRLGGHVLEVGAGAEVAARTGEDGDTDLGVVVDLIPGVDHDRHHLAGDGVLTLGGAIHGHDENVATLLHEAMRRGFRNV